MPQTLLAIHDHPVGLDRADVLLNVDLARWNQPGRMEQLWGRRVGPRQFEICCIPYFAYEMCLEDIVETGQRPDEQFLVQGVVTPRGRINLRLGILRQEDIDLLTPRIEGRIAQLKGLCERFAPGYYAIDVPTLDAREALLAELHDYVANARVFIETL